jgi:hypothetical protein
MIAGLKIKLSMAILAALAVSAVAFKVDLELIKRKAAEQRELGWKEQIRKDDEQYRKELEEEQKKIHARPGNDSKTSTRQTPLSSEITQ